ncbi:MAG: ribosome silencing factor [Candidatus Omnitrophica bacterium]|nr:ribosome silencing factor [Candidatus Omnitrophota bacterium]MDD5488397.1 ribosome silencing factor [Candidatus Omnitrophota bacterium]
MGKEITSQEKAKLIAGIAADKKGEDIVLMDMSSSSTISDWFVLVSAGSSRQLDAISKAVQKDLSKKFKISPLKVEGRNNPSWVLVDYGDVILHVFHKDIRDFYGLERLWSDAPRGSY